MRYIPPFATSLTHGLARAGSSISAVNGVLDANDARWSFFTPAAPTGVTATPGNAQAVVSWTAPAIVVLPLTDYSVQFSTNGGSDWTTATDAVSTATTATITGLTNGQAVRFRVAAVNAVGVGAYTAASSSVTPNVPSDPLFGSVALLLHADGTGSTFVDSSPFPKTVTANGNATQSASQSKFGGKSAVFDGADDSLTIPYAASLNLSTGDFAVECWWYPTSDANGQALFALNGSGPYSQVRVSAYTDSGYYFRFLTQSGSDWISAAGGGSWAVGQWHYVAAVRSGNQFRLYINGTSVISFTSSGSLVNNSSGVAIGSLNGGGDWLNGFIDEFRITAGSSRGLTGDTITVPTASFLDAGPMLAPAALSVTGGNAQLSLTWTAPSYNGGSAITGYSVEYTPSGGSPQTVSTGSTSTSYTLTGLTNGTAYTVKVAGVNAAGTGTYTAASSSVTPAAPPSVTLNNGSGSGTAASKWTLATVSPACDFQGRFITAGSAVTVLVDSVSGGGCGCDGEQYANIVQRDASGTALTISARNQEFSGRSFTLSTGDYLSVDITCSVHTYRAWVA
jgi:hypothetical protein